MSLRTLTPPLSLCLATLLTGCGWGGIAPNKDGSLPIFSSSEIATGAWTIVSGPSLTAPVIATPISAFLGGLTAQGTTVEGYLNIGSTDVAGVPQVSSCFGPNGFGVGISTVFVRGTASNGSLVLDGTFDSNDLHIAAQLSADRKTIVSGSYTVIGSCATNATQIVGTWTAPVTGTFVGSGYSSTGSAQQITAHLTQGNSINGYGEIPVDGTILFGAGACTSTVTLRGGTVDGYLGFFFGYSTPGPANDAIVTSEDNEQSSTLTLDNWDFYNATCGDVYSSQTPGILVRQ